MHWESDGLEQTYGRSGARVMVSICMEGQRARMSSRLGHMGLMCFGAEELI